MQRLTTLLLLAGITLTAQAQTVDDYQPDSDGDGCVGMSDLLSLLSVFGSCETQAFACGDPVTYQDYDYATVLIGEQCWFAENLRSENYENGDAIPTGLSDDEWENTSSGAIDALSLDEYGRFYNWYAVDDARGLCPSGWHVPTDGEWGTMEMALGMSESALNSTGARGTDQGTQMKTDYGWNDGGNGTNSSGFSGLPDGTQSFPGGGTRGYWWTSSLNDSNAAVRYLAYNNEKVYRFHFNLQSGLSVRCIQD